MRQRKPYSRFRQKGYVVFRGEVTARRKEVGGQVWDTQTGLDPITLTTDAARGCPPATREGDGSLVHELSDIGKLRAACALFSAGRKKIVRANRRLHRQ